MSDTRKLVDDFEAACYHMWSGDGAKDGYDAARAALLAARTPRRDGNMSKVRRSNPELFRKLSEPFPDREAASAALTAFNDDLYALREKHGIRDAYFLVAAHFKDGEDEAEIIVPFIVGDLRRGPEFAAFAYGFEQAEREQAVAAIVASGKRAAVKP